MLAKRAVVVSLIFTCVLLLLGLGTAARGEYARPAGQPSIEQPLIREGDLAVKLARAFGLGSSLDEAEAESRLSAAGIAPSNGWIADYPVTPDVADEIRDAVRTAASAGEINVSADTAVGSVNTILAQAGLSVEAQVAASDAETGEAPPDYPSTTVVNNYYETAGPPVVTYYAPPPEYTYLYGWVPYPFWCSGFWFPGYFVLHDFHRTVFIDRRPVFVSNHFRDPRLDRVVRVDRSARFRGSDRIGTARVGGFSGTFSRERAPHNGQVGTAARSSAPLNVTRNAPTAASTATVAPAGRPFEGRSVREPGRFSRFGAASNPGTVSAPSRSSRFFGVSRSEAATIPSSGMARGTGSSFRGGFSGGSPRSFSGTPRSFGGGARSFSAPMGGSHSIGSRGGFSFGGSAGRGRR
jgi:hypothetical protein